MTAVLLLLVPFLTATATAAQGQSPRFTTLAIEQGLSQNTVTAILQDRMGFLWLGTQDGLDRYDGASFVVYRHDPFDSASLPHDMIVALVEDRQGDLWIGTGGGGLARWRRDDDTFVRYRHRPDDPASLSSDRITALHLDRDGRLWIGTEESGLDRLDPASGEVTRFGGPAAEGATLSDPRVRAIYEDRLGNLWVGTLDGLNLIDRASGKVLRYHHHPDDDASLSDDRVRSVLEDRTGGLWIGTYDGLNRFDRARRTFVRFRHDATDPTTLGHDFVRALFEDREGRLWIGTDGGLHLYDPRDESFTRYRHDPANPNSLANDQVVAIAQDRGGVLWVGTQGGGVSRWFAGKRVFAHYHRDPSNPDGLSSNDVFALSEGPDGRIWIGTDGGLDAFDRERAVIERFRHRPDDPGSLADDRVMALLHDRRGALWVGTRAGGLDRWDAERRRFVHHQHDPDDPTSLGQNGVMSLLEDSRGTIWVGTFGGGLNRLDRADGRFTRLRHDPRDHSSLSDDRVTCLAEAPPGVLWIGTERGGLNRLDLESGEIRRFAHDPDNAHSLPSDAVWTLHADDAGVLWVGTQGGGLSKLERLGEDGAHFRHYDERDGLPSDVVSGIRSDAQGRLWLATNDGLACFDPATEHFERFTTHHGLQSREFNFGAHFQSATGELFFGGVAGFNAFFPERVTPEPIGAPIVLTAFFKLDEAVDLGRPLYTVDEISLSYRDHVVSFEFAALDFAAPEEHRYAYNLEGLTDEWIELGGHRRVTLTNLDPGRYVLRVRDAAADESPDQPELELGITVVPPPWRTPWAWGIYVAVSSLLVLGGAHGQRRRARRHEALRHARKAKQAAEAANRAKGAFLAKMSHELRTPMTGVIAMTELLVQSRPRSDQEGHLETIRVSGEAMLRILNDILDFSKIESGMMKMERAPFELRVCVEEALELLAPKAADKGLALAYWIDPDVPRALVGDGARTRQVLVNLLGNAVKFTAEGEVLVEVAARRQRDGRYEIRLAVEDTGIGIPENKIDQLYQPFSQVHASGDYGGSGLGLAICRQLCEAMGGHIEVASTVGAGSRFTFTIVGEAAAGAEPCPLFEIDPELRGKRLQVATADHTLARLLCRYGTAWGLQTTVIEAASDVATAHRARRLDAVIVDRAAGAAACGPQTEIETLCRARDVPLVVLVPVNQGGEPAGGLHDVVVEKPLRPAQLRRALRRVLDPSVGAPMLRVVGSSG